MTPEMVTIFINVCTVLGTAAGFVSIFLAILIYRRQMTASTKATADAAQWNISHQKTINEIENVLAAQYKNNDDPVYPDPLDARLRPKAEDEFKHALQEAGAKLDMDNLLWRQKTAADGRPGNLGWFVETPSPKYTQRWFVRRAKNLTVRPAVPRDYLEAWESETGLDPTDIEVDYRENQGRGNHPWFVSTYDGDVWRLSKGGRGNDGVSVTKIQSAE